MHLKYFLNNLSVRLCARKNAGRVTGVKTRQGRVSGGSQGMSLGWEKRDARAWGAASVSEGCASGLGCMGCRLASGRGSMGTGHENKDGIWCYKQLGRLLALKVLKIINIQ